MSERAALMNFTDYHRTVVGYHGTRLSAALDVVNGRADLAPSENDDDWLGHGVYFWEYGPRQALRWAEQRRKSQGWDEPIAIVASMVRLGFCFDLLDPANVDYLAAVHDLYVKRQAAVGNAVPKNVLSSKRLDCAVFEYAFALIKADESSPTADSARAVYVPTGTAKRVWKQSWISHDAHIQLCVRNPDCILGTWLHFAEEV